MKLNKNIGTALAATFAMVFAGGLLTPTIASAQTDKQKKRQNDKNLMRNLGIGAGAAAVYEGVRGHGTNALILGAGAALAGKKYEDARKAQTRENSVRKVYRYRNGKRIGYTKYIGGKRVGYYRM